MSTPAAIRVDDDLATSQTCIGLGAADDEATGGLDVVDGVTVQVLLWDDVVDHLGNRIVKVIK